jgi:hypothetical protein
MMAIYLKYPGRSTFDFLNNRCGVTFYEADKLLYCRIKSFLTTEPPSGVEIFR